MAKTIVMNPPAELERRDSDIPIPSDRFLKFSLFARLGKKPSVEKFPGTLVLRRFRAGEVICRQGEGGWTAFYLLTTEDVLALRKEQLESASTAKEKTVLGAEIEQLETRCQQIAGSADASPLRRAAIVYLAVARPKRSIVGGLLSRLAAAILPRPVLSSGRRPISIAIDAPIGVSYDSRQAFLREGDLFGEQSCLYGTPRSATIVAERDCYVLEMLRNLLDQVQGDKAYRAEMDAVYKARTLKDNLRNLSLFSDLTDEQFDLIHDGVDLIRCKDGQLLYDEHDRSDSMYVIRGGLVKVMRNVSSLLVAEDVRDWPKLLAFAGGESTSKAVGHLQQLLPANIRSGASAAAQVDVLAALNEIIKSPQLTEAAPVQELCSSPALAEFVRGQPAKRGDWPELERRRFNRLLLEAACPGVLRTCQRPSGPETVLAYLSRGDFFGEMGVLAKEPRTATCVAYVHPRPAETGPAADKWRRETDHVELVRLPEKTFWQLLEAAPNIRAKIEAEIAARTRQNLQRQRLPLSDDSREGLLSGRAEELGLIQGQKLMLIDLDRCTRCDECVQACVDSHADGYSRLFLDGPRFGKYLVPTTCRACLDPVCMIGCPVGSIHRGGNRQIVIEDWCIGCELCARNCPYGSIQMHDVGIIAADAHGWSYAPASLAGADWQSARSTAAHWLTGKAPFANDRAFQDSVRSPAVKESEEIALCFRYEFRMERQVLRTAEQFKLEVVSTDEGATVWINGRELPKPAGKPKGGKREYLLTQKEELLRTGRNVLAVQVAPTPPTAGKKTMLLQVRLDEIPRPDVAVGTGEAVEISEKVVTDVAVVCDQCSSQFGQRPACVTACPHDAALRVDARFNFPIP